ncbi:YhdP family protein [Woeseia oceani]|uniref:TIGR02099 family protein n=1 Tax=Woeseia oceani TaxID=1548547 RepID=A0A193LHX2_9GAMM|nr:YhdP family protein [Woeseia oceani]ANO51984.1 TIGR02099 family protein [Woeseia oceani]
MKQLFTRLLKLLAYLAAAVVILLAVAVGLFRLFLPRLPEYQDEIKSWANAAIGMQVEFSGMNARWRFSGPELNFYNAELLLPGEDGGRFAADEVSIGVELMRLLRDRRLVVDRVLVRDSAVDVHKGEDGKWRVQNIALDTLASRFARERSDGSVTVIAEDFDVSYTHPLNGQTVNFIVGSLRMTRMPERIDIDTVLELPANLGDRLSARISGYTSVADAPMIWNYSVDTRGLNLAGWSPFLPITAPTVSSGTADISFSVEQVASAPRNAVVEFDIRDMQSAGTVVPLGGAGRLEYQRDDAGWMLVANDFQLRSERGSWPATSFNMQGGQDNDGTLTSFSAGASYLNLDDLAELLPWIPETYATQFRQYNPSGEIANLTLSLADLHSQSLRYDVAMELTNASFLATERWPGMSGFSGSLRANRSGGRLEINSTDMQLDLARWLQNKVALDSAQGTVIWRRNSRGIMVLSDSIQLRNQDLSSRSSVQLSLPADGSSPVLDLESRWSISDLGAARRYLPASLIEPGLYRWLRSALVAGNVPIGTTRFSGALDKFPFDNGEGVFRIDAELKDATLRYSDLWPDAEIESLDLVVDRTRLFSENNTAVNAGNSVVDARIEIADLRDPVLTIDAFSTGTLGSIRQFAQRSPISKIFGGHLQRVNVSGDASFTLKLNYPILRRDEYTFTTRVRSSDGTLRIDGFDPPITGLNGAVSISRDDISAESLFGNFLGEPITIDLQRAGDELPGYSVVAEIDGRATSSGISAAFGDALARVIDGTTNYHGSIRFPRSDSDAPGPLQISVRSELDGMSVELPAPLTKVRNATRALSFTIDFLTASRIESAGRLGSDLQWSLAFIKNEMGWDFNRGVLAAGGIEAGTAETRGLHIVGSIPEFRLHDWLAIGRDAAGGTGIADRIRAANVEVEALHVLGQQFASHRIELDRSGTDWIVKIDGPQAIGTVNIPYSFSSDRILTLEMQRLVLPGSEGDDAEAGIATDPRTVPALSIRAEEFAFGDRHLGKIDAEFVRTPDGLRAERIHTEDPSFRIDGAAGWVVDTSEPSGQRTWVRATLKSTDIAATMQRLSSQPGIDGDDMEIAFDVSWSGGPRQDFVSALDGAVTVRFGTGRLDEVEPGAGRMFGLMSVVALPRRLALDFRDVLDKGFLFDEITGTFNLVDGDAFTCDLSLKGPAADIGIVGRAGLFEQDYTQAAIVSANVGNTLPVVGAVVAGPQVAAALLIFSQIFKKPLQEMGQVYYAIDGSWDEPEVDSTNAARFAEASKLAACLPNGR